MENKQKIKAKPKVVILDMDGVIVDSMPYHYIAWYEALRFYGIRISCFDVFTKEGEKWEKSLKYFLTRAGIKPTKKFLDKIFKLRQSIFKKIFKRFIFSGIPEFMNCLKNKGYLLGLVTGTNLKAVKKILPKRIHEKFNVIVSGDNVKRGKPHPEPYLKAARLLNVKPRECVVIENAPFGIEAAKRAGMFCIAVTTSLPKNYLKAADVVVEDVMEVFKFIEKDCSV